MPDISLRSSFRVNDDIVFRELGGEAVILDLASGVYFGLDETGTRMWQLIDRHGDLASVLAALCDEYDAPGETIDHDLLDLVARLSEKRLLVARDPAVT